MDAIPVRMMIVKDVAQMVREIDVNVQPDYVVVDDAVTPNDVIIIKNRYKVNEIIYIELANNYFLAERLQIPDTDQVMNLNMMSSNPVFLARIHLRTMDLSKINQLLLDFEITAPGHRIHPELPPGRSWKTRRDDPAMQKNKSRCSSTCSIHSSFTTACCRRTRPCIKLMIDSTKDIKKLTPFRTLVSKVKAMYPGAEEQKLYTVYENILYDKLEELKSGIKVT